MANVDGRGVARPPKGLHGVAAIISTCTAGELNPRARLTNQIVTEILRTSKIIANETWASCVNVSVSQIASIRRRRCWRSVEMPTLLEPGTEESKKYVDANFPNRRKHRHQSR
jgi:hypothetical protein